MSVRVEQETIRLTGRCLADDADPLLVALQEAPWRTVDLAGATRMHLAVVQVLLAAHPRIAGIPDNAFLARYLINLLQ